MKNTEHFTTISRGHDPDHFERRGFHTSSGPNTPPSPQPVHRCQQCGAPATSRLVTTRTEQKTTACVWTTCDNGHTTFSFTV